MLPQNGPIRPFLLFLLPGNKLTGTLTSMNELKKERKKRIPVLSKKTEPGNGRYYTSFRDSNGKSKRKRFSKDLEESQLMYHRWIIENYDNSTEIVTRQKTQGKHNFQESLPFIANAFIQHERERVRPDAAKRIRGTISIRVFDDNRRQVINILKWCKTRYKDQLSQSSFQNLMTETDYESMMLHFVNRLSNSQVNKHRQRFWDIVRFARRKPFRVYFPFTRDDVRLFGGVEIRKQRTLPTIDMIQKILSIATTRERLWIWLGIGLGFGNDDLARCRPEYFDVNSYDMRRGKTGFARYGVMRPMVWGHFQEYLKNHPREKGELLFITAKGNPLVWVKTKTDEELKNGTTTNGPSQIPFKRCDSLCQRWNKLKKDANLHSWKEGFYIWRHLGATAYASREGVGIAQLRTFLGHGKSQVADEYMKPLTPETKKVVKWVNEILNSSNIDEWKMKPS